MTRLSIVLREKSVLSMNQITIWMKRNSEMNGFADITIATRYRRKENLQACERNGFCLPSKEHFWILYLSGIQFAKVNCVPLFPCLFSGAFRLYDVDNDGFITRDEMYNIVDAIYQMVVSASFSKCSACEKVFKWNISLFDFTGFETSYQRNFLK